MILLVLYIGLEFLAPSLSLEDGVSICPLRAENSDKSSTHVEQNSPGSLADYTNSNCEATQTMSTSDRTFIMVKHDGVQRGLVGEILKRFEQRGLKLAGLKLVQPTRSLIEKHYEEHAGKPFFAGLVDYGTSGPVIAMVWQGFESVKVGRSLTGATKPVESAPGTIRGDYGLHVGRNLIHASDSNDSAKREIALWFTEAEVHDWKTCNDAWLYESK